jgi:hypothetical protein
LLEDGIQVEIFENKISRLMFGLRSDAIGDWRRLHSKETHTIYNLHPI